MDERGLNVAERGDDDPIERLRRAGQASYADVDAVEYQRELRGERAEDRTDRYVHEWRPLGSGVDASDVAEGLDRLDG